MCGTVSYPWELITYEPYYRIAGFSHEDFNLAVWSIRNIIICEKFHVKIYFASTCKLLLELFTVLTKLNQVHVVFSSLFITLIPKHNTCQLLLLRQHVSSANIMQAKHKRCLLQLQLPV